ncbi:hypothetical protein LINPERPRIM_LOCUS21445 [Linum perenne]
MTKLDAAVAAIAVLLVCSIIQTTAAYKPAECGHDANTYTNFPYNVKAVIYSLAAETNTTSFSPSRYYPDETNAGSAKGHANCDTSFHVECKRCLSYARDVLASCENSNTGMYRDSSCTMWFWQI